MMNAWRSIGRSLSRRTRVVLAGVLIVTIVLLIGARQLDFATGQDSYLDPSSQVAKDNSRYQSLFGGENMVVLFTMAPGTSVVDLFDGANVAQFGQVEDQLAASPAVQSVVSPVTVLTWTQSLITSGVASEILARSIEREPDPAAAAIRQQDSLVTIQRLGSAGKQTFENPDWVRFLLFGNDGFTIGADNKLVTPPDDSLVVRKPLRAFIPDAHHAILAGVLVGNAGLDQLAVGSDVVTAAFAGRTFDNATVTITGTPTFLTDINDYLQGGMLTLGGIAVLVMVVILTVAFRVRWRLLPLLGMAVGVAWGFGLFGFTGSNLSLVTIAGFPILIGLGIEFAIQVQNRLEEERLVTGPHDPFEETSLHMGPPLLTATIAAVIAFVTMRISRVPMVQDFGLLLAIGIVALLVAGIVLPIAIVGARERRSPPTDVPPEGWVEKSVAWLGSLPRVAVLPLVLVAVALPVLGLVLETGSRIESDPINWANQGSTSIKNARTLERETGFATTLGVFVETTTAPSNGVFTDQVGAFVFDLVERSLSENAELAEASSLATTAGWLAEVPGATSLPPTGVDMLEAYQQAPAALQSLLVAEDGNATQVLFQAGPSSLEQRAVVLQKVQQAIADPGSGGRLPPQASATTGGLAVVGVGLLENITANRAQLTIVALLLVAAFVVLRHRDLVRGVLTMIPVLLAVGTSAVLVRVLGVTLSPLTTVGGPLVVATCAEFAVLLVARYSEERAKGLDPDQSNSVAAQRTGRAFFTSALTTLGGFAVLMFSTLPLLRDFGVVVTINIGVALLAALVVVPPLIKEADRRGLLAMGPEVADDRPGTPARRRASTGWVAGVVLAVAGLTLAIVAVNKEQPAAASPLVADSVEAPATLPPPATVAPTTPPTTPPSTVPGDTVPPSTTLPPGAAERPSGLVGGAFWDGLVAVGVDPGIARCAADDLLATTSEADLLALGIATVPRPAEVNALLDAAAKRCGVTQDQLDAAAAAAGG
jgi:hydrophobe/amphiphile efflux-3 (HAE3) family protein